MPRRRPKKNRAVKSGTSRQAILVLGMHRSGTSALTRVFNFLGADLPKSMMGTGPANELGHWEPLDLVNLHDEILNSMGSNWHDWRAIDPEWNESSAAEAFKDRLLAGLKNDYGDSPLFVVKDPRICRFVPMWCDVIERHGARPQVVMVLRNPLEVAASLRERDGFLAAKSLLLWLRHVLDAERTTRQLPRALVTYDRLMMDWRQVASDVAAKTEIRWPRRSNSAELEIERFLSNKHRHHAVDPKDLAARRTIVDWVSDTHAALLAMSNGDDEASQQRRLDTIRREFDKAAAAFGLVLADESERAGQLQQDTARLRVELDVSRQVAREREAALTQERTQSSAVLREREVELTRAQEAALTHQREQLSAALRDAQVTLTRANEDVARLKSEVANAISAGQQHEQAAVQLTRDLEGARRFLRESQTEVQRLAGELDVTKREADRISGELDQVRDLLHQKEAQISQDSAALTAARAEVQIVKTNFDRLTREEAGRAAEKERLQQALNAAQADMQRLVDRLEQTQQEAQKWRNELERSQEEGRQTLRTTQADLQRTAGEFERAVRETALISAELKATSELLHSTRIEAAGFKQDIGRARDETRGLRSELGRARDEADEVRAELDRVRGDTARLDLALGEERQARLRDADRAVQSDAALGDARRSLERLSSALIEEKRARSADMDAASMRLNAALGEAGRRQTEDAARMAQLTGQAEAAAAQAKRIRAELDELLHAQHEAQSRRWRARLGRLFSRADRAAFRREYEAIRASKLFDPLWYLERYPDVAASGADPLEHYIRYGSREGRDPHPLFDSAWYVGQAEDIASSGLSALGHYVSLGVARGLDPNPLFDTDWYLAQNPVVAASGVNPLHHFRKEGAARGLDPHPMFDTSWYLENNPDVAAAGGNPLLHYIEYGKRERRQTLPPIAGSARREVPEDKSEQPNSNEASAELIRRSGLFDPEWYSANNPDVSLDNALSHYINHGDKDGRDPHPLFDVDWYREKYLGENADSVCAFVDYLSYRGDSTRNPHPLFDIKYIENRYGFAFPKETSALEHFCLQRIDVDTCPLFDSKLYRYQVENESHRVLTEPSLVDYLRRGYRDLLVRPNILFDPKTYINHNKLELSGPALTHYALYGDRVGLRTHDHFDAGIYNSNRTDAKQTTAIEHFFVSSPRQRVISQRYFSAPLPDEAISFVKQIAEHDGEFDVEFYRAAYPDLRGVELERHFVEWGRKEGRSGTARHFVQQMGISIREISLAFYADEYLDLSSDLQAGFSGDFLPLFLHYLEYGRFEKRSCGKWQLYIDPDQYPISLPSAPLVVAPTTNERKEVCVLMHVFYPDLFGELVSYAQNFGGSLGGAHINVVDSVWTPSVHKNVRELTPDAFVMMSANSGRDIGGFLRLLDHVHISRYELFAFMHTKKSPHVAAAKAEYWRRRLLNAFAGNKSIAQDCIRRFKDDPSIGLIACADWKENDIGKNAAQFTRILDLLEIDDDHREIEYVSGTMFLIRSEIVQRLYEKLRTVEFESGDNQTLEFNMDGQVAHSIERAIGNLVRQLGYRIEWVSQ